MFDCGTDGLCSDATDYVEPDADGTEGNGLYDDQGNGVYDDAIQNPDECILCGDEEFTDVSAGLGTTCQRGDNPGVLNPVGIADSTAYNVGQAKPTSFFE